MSWLNEISRLFGGGSSSTAVASTNNTTTVTVNPTILNAVDLSPLEAPTQRLVDALSGIAPAIRDAGASAGDLAPAVAGIGDAITKAADAQRDNADRMTELATYVSVAGLAFALFRMVAR